MSEEKGTKPQDEKPWNFMSGMMAEMCGPKMPEMMANCCGGWSAEDAPSDAGKKQGS